MGEDILRELRGLRERQEAEIRTLISRALDEGTSTQDIAEALGVSRATLWRHYGAQLRRGTQARGP